jgi:hypothetical protein
MMEALVLISQEIISTSLNPAAYHHVSTDLRSTEMREIYRPFVTSDDPDRDLRCQDAIQFAFDDLAQASMAAGWTERESLEAILYLAEDRLRTLAANDDSKALLDILKKMIQAPAA